METSDMNESEILREEEDDLSRDDSIEEDKDT